MNNRITYIMIVMTLFITAGYVSFFIETTSESTNMELSDSDIFELVTRDFDFEKVSGKKIIMGTHKGNIVVADFPCSDICPPNTVKIIRYDVEANQCMKRKGKVEELATPMSISMGLKSYCVPEVIFGKQEIK